MSSLSRVFCIGFTLRLASLASAQPDLKVPEPRNVVQRPALGAMIQSGVLVTGVLPGSVGAAMGLQKADLILRLNGRSTFRAEDLQQQVRNLPFDQPVSLLLLRNEKLVVLAANSMRPPEKPAVPVATPPQQPKLPRIEAGPETPPSEELFKSLINQIFQDRVDGAFLSPEKVEVDFESVTVGIPQANLTTNADKKTVLHIPFAVQDGSYYPITTRMKITETFAGGLAYTYTISGTFEAYGRRATKGENLRWAVIQRS